MSAKAVSESRPSVILVVEDDPNDVLLLKRAFAKARLGASLHFVSSGQEAISYLQGQPPFDNRYEHPVPNILLLDLNMPGLSGLELLQWLASHPERASLIVVVFSSYLAPAICVEAAMLGAHSCLTKPLDPSVLLPVLANLSTHSGPATPQENCAPQLRSSS